MGGNSAKHILDKYAALAQVYYWSQIYETDKNSDWERIVSSTLTDDFTLYNLDGTWKGKEQYITRLTLLKKWQNTHHIKGATVKKGDENNQLVVELECTYQCLLPDFSLESYNIIHYIKLELRKNELPLIASIYTEVIEKLELPEFNTSYAYNRAISFMYYLLYCFETHKSDLTKYNHLFKPGFKSQINSDTLFNAPEELSKWIQLNSTQIGYSNTELKNISVNGIKRDIAIVSFDICQIPSDRSTQIRSTHYECSIHYSFNEHFSKIETIKITDSIIMPIKLA